MDTFTSVGEQAPVRKERRHGLQGSLEPSADDEDNQNEGDTVDGLSSGSGSQDNMFTMLAHDSNQVNTEEDEEAQFEALPEKPSTMEVIVAKRIVPSSKVTTVKGVTKRATIKRLIHEVKFASTLLSSMAHLVAPNTVRISTPNRV